MAHGVEADRLEQSKAGVPWKRWGPYLSERQWGTVREDYSDNGDAWNYFSHDQARSRAYKWGEDGIAGFCDDHQRLCFGLALWNGVDPILKERMFGLTNSEGNHGEDVKEYYFNLDATPTSSYLKYRYRYPLNEFPYADLVATNHARSRLELEYELLDTGVFDDDRYVDVDVEYAKGAPDDVHVRITLINRSHDRATVHLLPSLWFRNNWWMDQPKGALHARRRRRASSPQSTPTWASSSCAARANRRCCSPRTRRTRSACGACRTRRPTSRMPSTTMWCTDRTAPSTRPGPAPRRPRTTCSTSLPNGVRVVQLRLCRADAPTLGSGEVDRVFESRIADADEFYASITPAATTPDEAMVMRQALAGMLWGKQLYSFDLDRWLDEHHVHPLRHPDASNVRNRDWFHMINEDVISMPDTWEYPWYASWDLAFHTVALAMVDVDDAKGQLELMLRELYLHPSGQLPAYEWNFSDVNPPVHAWATLAVYETELEQRGAGDVAWLKGAFQKLLVNFTWWINRKDPTGRNVFEGGFLGLDNIGVFDRSAPLPTGGHLEQSDGTAWMAFYSQCMLGIALELSAHDPLYEDMVLKFAEHFLFIAAAMDRIGDNEDELWDEEDGFFYDVLRLPDGSAARLKVRSMVGLLPLCATTILPLEGVQLGDDLLARLRRRHRVDAGAARHHPRPQPAGGQRAAHVGRAERDASCAGSSPACSTRTSS